MARITYGALIESINGSIGGTTFQTNRYGFSVKRKPVPSKPNTPSQNAKKSTIAQVSQDWIGLTAANRTAWNTYAATFPRPSRLNPDSDLNGVNYFQAYHLFSFQRNDDVVTDPSAAQQTLSFVSTAIVNTAGVLDWVSDITVSGGNWRMLLYTSRLITNTTQLRRNRLRFTRGRDGSGDFTQTITTQYSLLFGSIPEVGDIIIVQEIWLNTGNGQIFEGLLQRITVT